MTNTTPTHITFFEDRAQVQRHATLQLDSAGHHTFQLEGITRFIDDQSLVVSLSETSSASLIIASVKRKLVEYSDTEQDEALPEDIEAHAQYLRKEVREAELQLKRTQQQLRHHQELFSAILTQMRLVPHGDACSAESFDSALKRIEEDIASGEIKEDNEKRALKALQKELTHTKQRLEQDKQLHHKVVASIEVQLQSSEPCEVVLNLSYMTGCALWRPTHRAQLTRHSDDKSRGYVHIETQAAVWQNTGELWENVTCSLSTARPTQSAKPPVLTDDRLYVRNKTHAEQKEIKVAARDEVISSTGEGPRKVDSMPGVDDGGEPLLLQAQGKVTIQSTGKAHVLTMDTLKLPCTIDLVAMPELSELAYLRAKTIWSHTAPLLAGPVTILREHELAGQTQIKFVAPGEPLDIGFGHDSSLRIKRDAERKTIDKMLSRHKHEERKITLHISNLSASPKTLHILERIPVSEIEQVKVQLVSSEGREPNQDGFLEIPTNLEGNETKQLKVVYNLDLDPKVRLNF